MKRLLIILLLAVKIFLVCIFFLPRPVLAERIIVEQSIFVNNNVFPLLELQEGIISPLRTDRDWFLDYKTEARYLFADEDFYWGYFNISSEKFQACESTISFLDSYFEDKPASGEMDEYGIDFSHWRQSLEGVILGATVWRRKEPNLSLNVGAKILKGQELRLESYRGTGWFDDEGFAVNLQLDGAYSRLSQETEMVDLDFRGQGYSLDYSLVWQLDKETYMQLEVENAFSRIRWYDVYTREGEYETDNLKMDKDGKYYFEPVFTGGWSYRNFKSRLIPEYDLHLIKGPVKLGLFYRDRGYPYLEYSLTEEPATLEAGLMRNLFTLSFSYRGLTSQITGSIYPAIFTGLAAQIGLEIEF